MITKRDRNGLFALENKMELFLAGYLAIRDRCVAIQHYLFHRDLHCFVGISKQSAA